MISLHGGGSPQAMKREIYRRYPIEERRSLVERLLDRGVAETGSSGAPNRQKQPGQCCATGCQPQEEGEGQAGVKIECCGGWVVRRSSHSLA